MTRNNKNRLICFAVAAFFISLLGPLTTKAQFVALKTDASDVVAKTTDKINKASSNAQNTVEKVAGQRVNYIKGKITSIKAKAASVKESAEAMKNDLTEVYEQGQSTVKSGESLYQDAKSTTDDLSDVTSAASTGLNLISMKKQRDSVAEQIEERKTALKEQADATNAANAANLATLQSMLSDSDDAATRATINTQIEEAQTAYKTSSAVVADKKSLQAYYEKDSEYQQLQEQLADLDKQLKTTANDESSLLSSAAKSLKKLFKKSDSEKTQEYATAISNNFLGKDEEETAENNARVLKYRRRTLLTDTVYALQTAANLRINQDELQKAFERWENNTQIVDYSNTSTNVNMRQRIQDVELLYNYVVLLVAEMRVKTARAVMLMPTKLQNYSRDPSQFNFNDYIFTQDDIKSDEGKVDALDSVLRQ